MDTSTSVFLEKDQFIDASLVKINVLSTDNRLPLVITPNAEGVDAAEWAKKNEEVLHKALLEHGGILFRGFSIRTQDDFNRFVGMNCSKLLDYNEGSSPRTKLGGKVYTSTDYPPDQTIPLHNELSYSAVWPRLIFFYSLIAAQQGGETPIADVRGVYERIHPDIRQVFEEKGWMLVRNFGDGFALPWQQVFSTESKEEVEAYCLKHNIQFEWKSDDRLRTRQVRKAVREHPETKEKLWFNHMAFWHESTMDPDVYETLVDLLGPDGLPYNTYYGDGTPIEVSVVEEIRKAYEAETVMFPWQEGDLLMLDNMLVAHARSPFVGERKTLVAMGDEFSG